MANQKLYKIRDPATGLYSMGGVDPRWTKKGKVWTNIGHLKNHLRQVGSWGNTPSRRKVYVGCEVVVIEVVEDELERFPVMDLIDEQDASDEAKKKAREAERKQRREESERQQARNLIAKYGTNP